MMAAPQDVLAALFGGGGETAAAAAAMAKGLPKKLKDEQYNPKMGDTYKAGSSTPTEVHIHIATANFHDVQDVKTLKAGLKKVAQDNMTRGARPPNSWRSPGWGHTAINDLGEPVMATVAIRFPTQSPLSLNAAGQIQLSGQNVTLINEYNQVVTLPIVAPTTQYGELAPNWQQVPRPGVIEPAFNVRGPRPLRTITLQVTVVDMSNTTNPIDDLLNSITTFLQNSTTIRLSYATFDNQYVSPSGTWVCTSWQPAVIVRDPDSWSPISVQGNLVLTEANPQPFAANTPTGITAPGPNSTVVSPAAPSVPANTLHQAGSSTKSYPQGQNASTASGTAQQGSKVHAASQTTSPSTTIASQAPGIPMANNYTVISGDTLHENLYEDVRRHDRLEGDWSGEQYQ